VLIDVFAADPVSGERPREAIRDCRAEGSLVACEVIWAEIAAAFPSTTAAHEALDRLGVASWQSRLQALWPPAAPGPRIAGEEVLVTG
jgi:hypothetical protein